MSEPRPLIRLDKWLWQARFFKTRTLAGKVVAGGHVRVNSLRAAKPAQRVGAGDTLTFPQGDRIRVIRVLAPGERRGPAAEAQTLYEDLTPAREDVPQSPRFDGKGRPTKKDRRSLDLNRLPPLE
ncbi:MAG: RNA-binding protein S4 [Confluentimicrobium sp.]|uniref:Ribosome-associated heat shock protein Hsp15 n=1 Tax=Actibacterium naphthalenivorans TaxID=1614693 RepID=A0A840CEX2_9RHOB|nr:MULTISPECIES: RNA-binding S4 domain-containing protein [Actibacterium]KGB82256.1 tRNA synthetase RNA-binding protein [Rhodovulum sp. NI22]MDY6858716.1 RNA-binding S4 domain-containing protein [Pseudomonadota bacterium]ALG90975.1 tRNA synthetase RNA-binding protein [Actibacterium sp. EMB200-NS6]MBB4023353.1 ribosome-associated heat shock protein Hsp15 [Actibacterium naphthalenivorans]MBC56052.1 RNA-binding protein S4 [Actibacterium sp.]